MGPLRELSSPSGGRLMGTRCQEKEAQDMIAMMHKTVKETHAAASDGQLLLQQQFTDLQEKTRHELDRLMKFAKILDGAATVSLGVAIIGVPWILTAGSKEQA